MLRYKETEDIDARFSEVERTVGAWRQAVSTANQVARTEFNNRLRISLIHHDAALEGEVLSYSEIKAAVDPSIISDPSLIPSYEEIRRFDDACNFAAEQAANKKKPFKLDTIRELYSINHIAPDEKAKGPAVPQGEPRSTGSTITTSRRPRKSSRSMRKLGEWIDDPARFWATCPRHREGRVAALQVHGDLPGGPRSPAARSGSRRTSSFKRVAIRSRSFTRSIASVTTRRCAVITSA